MPSSPTVRTRTARLIATGITALMLVAGLAGCGLTSTTNESTPVQGTGDTVREDRTTSSFTRISISVGARVIVRESQETKVTLEAQGNLLPLINTSVKDGQLIVTAKSPGIVASEPITLTIATDSLESLALSGGATGTVEAEGGPLKLDVSGGATILAIGSVDALDITAAGGTLELEELSATSARVKLTGGATATILVSGAVTGEADAGSTLILADKPASVDVKTSGGATVQGG